MKKTIFPIVSAAVSLGVALAAWVMAGRYTGTGLMLGLMTAALAWAVWVVFRTAQVMVSEPEAADVREATGRRRKELEREKQALLKALKELEFDHEMGKISDADYQEIGGNYRARAVRVMRQLDVATGETNYRELVERDLQNRLKARRAPAGDKQDAKPEAPAAEVARAPSRPACAKCQTLNDADAEFCKKCGARLVRGEATS